MYLMVYRVERAAESRQAAGGSVSPRIGVSAPRYEHESRLLLDLGVPPAAVRQAVGEAARLGVPVEAALLAARAVGEDDLYRAFAAWLDAPFVGGGAELDPGLHYGAAAGAGVAPLAAGGPPGARWLVAPRGRA
ncbi:MAG: hypothetical protein KGM42_17765, partial [Hyphomicrobiales bacterium]|nr:hypothetical protein [Hyphomicrobiales bacterium]